MDSKSAWKKWGDIDPYYGVLSRKEFRRENLEANKDAFFRSGESHVEKVLEFLEEPTEGWGAVIDFGCGTGRLLLPFAKRFKHAVGLDISEGMLAETR